MIGDESLRHRLMVRVGQPLTASGQSASEPGVEQRYAQLASSVHSAARGDAPAPSMTQQTGESGGSGEFDAVQENHMPATGGRR